MNNVPTASPTPRRLMLCGLILGLFTPSAGFAIAPTEADPAKIMTAVENRDTGDKMISRMQMTITDGAKRSRVRVVRSRTMKFGAATKQIMFFESPADIRNTAMLSVDYDDGGKDDDQWLYLPSLHKSTRISSSDKSGSFMGSDFTYSDMTKKDPKNYSYILLAQSVTFRGEDCWKIEARPSTAKEKRETGNVKSVMLINKSKLLPVKVKSWVREGKKLKLMIAGDIRKVGGLWLPHKMAIRTVRGKKVQSTTVLKFLSIKVSDKSVKAADFSQRRLEKGI